MVARFVAATCAVTVGVALISLATAATTGQQVVLGKKHLTYAGFGWGTAHPRAIFNGGDPSGHAWHLTWRNWGTATAYARGLTILPRPGGNFYPKPARIELRASRISRCTKHGSRAYTRLAERTPAKPGGRLGKWESWSGWNSICNAP